VIALGMALGAVGLVLLIGELHLSTGGALGALAVIGVVAGAAVATLAAGASPLFLVPFAVVPGGVCASLVVYAVRNTSRLRGRVPLTGPHTLVGRAASVRTTIDPVGQVFVDGALWRARSAQAERLDIDEEVVVVAVRDMTLLVRRNAHGGFLL